MSGVRSICPHAPGQAHHPRPTSRGPPHYHPTDRALERFFDVQTVAIWAAVVGGRWWAFYTPCPPPLAVAHTRHMKAIWVPGVGGRDYKFPPLVKNSL